MNHNLLRVSSDFKQTNSNSNSDFSVSYNNNPALEHVVRVVMKQADIPNVFYNINETGFNFTNTGNNQLTITNDAAVQSTATIPIGQYTISELIIEINTFLADPAFTNGIVTISQDPLTKKIEFITSVPAYKFSIDQCTILSYLGFAAPSVYQYNAVLSADSFSNLSGVTEVYITSQKISDSSNMIVRASTVFPVILVCPITVAFGFIEHYLSPHDELDDIVYPSSEGTSIRQVDLQLRDKFANILDIGTLSLNLILKVYHGELN